MGKIRGGGGYPSTLHFFSLCTFIPAAIRISSLCCVLSGSDGLVKLWTIKTNECVKTLDAHQDKVWGLHGNRRDDKMVTGSADSNITVWEVSVFDLQG